MQFSGRAVALLAFFLGSSPAQVIPSSPIQPTPLEAFAKQPGSRVAWSVEIGRIDSRDAHAIVTAIEVQDTAQPPDRLRGIRVDLSDQDAKDQVYLGEETLGAFRDAMDEISKSSAPQESSGGVQYVGARLFWYGDRKMTVHTLTAAHYFQWGYSGLALQAVGGWRFQFPERDASLLSELISRAIQQLKTR